VSVFVFFGLVATCGTAFVQGERVPLAAVVAGAGTGALACAILVANNLRDLPGDERVGKRTLAVVLGDRRTRLGYASLVLLGTVGAAVALSLAVGSAVPLVGLVVLARALPLVRDVLRGASGRAVVPVLAGTGLVQLLSAVALTAALVGIRLT
jgi:1,4-dihydroxy-2-naphthoate octaprenyltransferase